MLKKSPVVEFIKDKLNNQEAFDLANAPRVITISRQYGCPGIPIAEGVAKILSNKGKSWSVVDKQIVEQASKEFNLPEKLIEKMAKSKPIGAFEELFLSFSDFHLPNDVKLKKTIARLIRTVALTGNVVILGRGGVVLARDIPHSLHVHLYASIEWRKESIKKMDNITSDFEALGKIKTIDQERTFLLNYFSGESSPSYLFDVNFNCEYLKIETIIDSIIELAKTRNI